MRRNLPLFVMVGVAGVLVSVLAVLAQSTSTTSAAACCSPPTCAASKPSASSSTDAKIIDEMIAILKETKSEETFIVTAMALGRMGPEAKRALPQLIRNAERLELFADLFDSEASKGDREVAQQVGEAIMMLAESNKDGRPMGYGYPTPPMPCANGSYGPPSVVGGWNPTAVVPPAVSPCPTTGAPCPVAAIPAVTAIYPGAVPPSCPTTGAPCPVAAVPAVPGTIGTPVAVPTPDLQAPTPLPAAKKASHKGGKSRTPVAPAPSPIR